MQVNSFTFVHLQKASKYSNYSKLMKTNNKTVLITGGGSGIGFEIAKLFSQNGSKVIITGRNEDRLKAAAQWSASELMTATRVPHLFRREHVKQAVQMS